MSRWPTLSFRLVLPLLSSTCQSSPGRPHPPPARRQNIEVDRCTAANPPRSDRSEHLDWGGSSGRAHASSGRLGRRSWSKLANPATRPTNRECRTQVTNIASAPTRAHPQTRNRTRRQVLQQRGHEIARTEQPKNSFCRRCPTPTTQNNGSQDHTPSSPWWRPRSLHPRPAGA